MTLTSDQVISQEAVREQVLEAVQGDLVFRQAFDEYDATDINSDAVQVPVVGSDLEETGTVPEATEVVRKESDSNKVTVTTEKYMSEAAISREAIEDSILGEIDRQVRAHRDALMDGLDTAAYNELNNGITRAAEGDGSVGELSYGAVVGGLTALEADGYSPDLIIVSAQSKGDLLTDDDFTRASQMGDDVIMNGQFGEVAGMPVAVSNVGDLGAGEAFMVDTDQFGIEVIRSEADTIEYWEREKDQVVVQTRTRRGYKALRGDAAVKLTP